jgi:uncharacterized coiled-coil protein SlyX
VRRPVLAAALLAAAALLTGCSGDGGGDGGAQTASAPAGGAADGAGEAAAGAVPPQAALDAAVPDLTDPAAPLGRVGPAATALIRTAELSVRVDDPRAAAQRAGDIAVDSGGSVSAERSSGQDGRREATLLLRVPPERFETAVAALAGLGEEQSRSLATEGVSDQVVDLESRLATQRASVERVRALLAQAENLGEVVQIEGELTRRTADLESLQARLAALTERVQMSTITLHLYAGQSAAAGDDLAGFTDGVRAGSAAFLATARVLAATVGALLPFVPLALLAALGWRLWSRRTTATAG